MSLNTPSKIESTRPRPWAAMVFSSSDITIGSIVKKWNQQPEDMEERKRLATYLAEPEQLVDLPDLLLEESLLRRREGGHDPVVELHQLVDPPEHLEGRADLLVGRLDVARDGELVRLPDADLGQRVGDGGWWMEDGGWRMEDGGWWMEEGGCHLLDQLDQVPIEVDVHHAGEVEVGHQEVTLQLLTGVLVRCLEIGSLWI